MGLDTVALLAGRAHPLTTEGLTFVVPLRSAVVELTAGERLLVDRTTWATLPAGTAVSARALSSHAQMLVLTAQPALLAHVIDTYCHLGVDRPTCERYFRPAQLLPRTIWVYELCQRYLFEREVLNAADNEATRFLETEIVKEAFFLCRDRERGEDRAPLVQQYSSVVAGAVAFIEAHLFDPEGLLKLSHQVGASESTLLRAFKKELGSTPAAYWRGRRLDEALGLLRGGHAAISEIAGTVGYDNPAAFAEAFHARFGQAPSAFLSTRRKRQAPA